MIKKLYKYKLLFAIALMAILTSSTELWSQNFIMETNTATYNATCGGVIKMKNVAGTIVRNNGNTLGTDSANAIKGVVDWASTTTAQPVQALYYERMVLSGGAIKTIPDGVYITGTSCSGFLAGYDSLNIYPFYITNAQLAFANTFSGTFNYIGTLQTVYHVTGDDSYANIAFNPSGGGIYSIADNLTTTINGTITLPTGDSLAVLGDFFTGTTSSLAGKVEINNGGTFNIGTGDITFNGNVNVNNGSIISDVVGDGSVIIGSGSTLALTALTGILNFGPATDLVVTGNLTNSFSGSNGSNLLFDCASTVTYNGAAGQLVLPTPDVAGNRYGNLVLTTASKVGGIATYGNDINICTNFSLAGGNLDMRTNGAYLQMNSAVGTVTYGAGTGTEEVLGSFRRKLAASGDVALATAYTFNNYKTTVSFTDLPDASATAYYQLYVDTTQSPVNFVAGTDIDRKIVPTYDLANFEYTLQAGYKTNERPLTWTSPLSESDLKFFEADGPLTTNIEKVAGVGYNRDSLSVLHSVSLGGLIGGTGAVDGVIERFITSGNDLVLRASNSMISIVDGRWSNPNVWDEGRIPQQTDNVEIRTMVYVGIDGPFAATTGGGSDSAKGNTRRESADYDGTPGKISAANTITIGEYANASLIIGNEDNGPSYVHSTLSNGTSFVNNNTNTTVSPNLFTWTHGSVVKSGVNGLWLTGKLNPTDDTPQFGTHELKNSGAVNNQGIIELGN